jgi:threonine dehydrogenase-like Zn-dependent dehydrogenase
MKAIAVARDGSNAVRLVDVPRPSVDDVPGGRGVLVRVVRVGVDGTDKEILAGEYGAPPPGETTLIIGHESFGVVEAVGPAVHGIAPGDYVVATVRRRGTSPYDAIGMYDMTTDDRYVERGINLAHGFLAEYYVDDADYIVRVPPGVADAGVLLEPTSIVEKGITQAYEIQRRLKIWQPRTAFVLGAGTIGLLAAMVLRLRGLDVHVFARGAKPNRNAEMAEGLGATYHSTADQSFRRAAQSLPPAGVIFEATGFSPLAFDAMDVLGKNGVLVLSSVTGGSRTAEVPADRINLGFVLGNKVMVGTVNANRAHFEAGVRDHAHAKATFGDWAVRLITHRVKGLERYEELVHLLNEGKDVIKVVCEISPQP